MHCLNNDLITKKRGQSFDYPLFLYLVHSFQPVNGKPIKS